jgi:SPP1 gp7 family putative phage head morphogenesis protein
MRLYNATMKINRLEMLKANIGLEMIKGHDELEKFMGEILQGRTEEELRRQAGILGKTITNNAQTAHAIVNASYKNATFSDRVWLYHDEMKADLAKMLKSGLIQGKNPRTLARELEKYVMGKAKGGAKFNAERLMRTELARVQTEAQKQSFERNGFEEYTFLANSGCCDICQDLNGKHFKVADMMPGENAAPLHPHCRCSTSAYSDRKEYDEWLDFLENGGTTEEYNKQKAANRKYCSFGKRKRN